MTPTTHKDRDEVESAFKTQHARIAALKEAVIDAEDHERKAALAELVSGLVSWLS